MILSTTSRLVHLSDRCRHDLLLINVNVKVVIVLSIVQNHIRLVLPVVREGWLPFNSLFRLGPIACCIDALEAQYLCVVISTGPLFTVLVVPLIDALTAVSPMLVHHVQVLRARIILQTHLLRDVLGSSGWQV